MQLQYQHQAFIFSFSIDYMLQRNSPFTKHCSKLMNFQCSSRSKSSPDKGFLLRMSLHLTVLTQGASRAHVGERRRIVYKPDHTHRIQQHEDKTTTSIYDTYHCALPPRSAACSCITDGIVSTMRLSPSAQQHHSPTIHTALIMLIICYVTLRFSFLCLFLCYMQTHTNAS